MESTADQYQDRPAGVLFCFGILRYAAYFDFSRQNTTITRPKFPYFTVVCLYLLSFVETPRKFIIAELSIRKLGSSSVLIIINNYDK